MKEPFALLIIDVQEGLFNQKTEIYNKNKLIDNINKLIDYTRNTGNHPIFIQHNNNGFLKKFSTGWELYKSLNFREDDIRIEKEKGDSFKNTSLKLQLNKLGIKKLVMCGLVSHGCVKATCSGAIENGFEALLVSDGHSSFSKDAEKKIKEVNVEMGRLIKVKNTEEIIRGTI